MGVGDDPPCQSEACALQTCLNKNTYNPDRCDEPLKQLYKCCREMHRKKAGLESTACPIEEKVEAKLKSLGVIRTSTN